MGLPLAFELRQIKGTKVIGQILAINGCSVIKEGKKTGSVSQQQRIDESVLPGYGQCA